MSQNNTISTESAVNTISPFRLKAINESLSMMSGHLSVEVSDGWTSSGPSQVLAIRPKDTANMKFLPVLHVSDLEPDMTPSEIAERIVSIYHDELHDIDFTQDATSKDYVLRHVVPRLINKDKVGDAQDSGIITEHFIGNLYIYWTVIIKDQGDEQISYALDQRDLDSVGVTIDEIKPAALGNIINTFEITSIEDVLGLSDDSLTQTFYVATNRRRHYGATVLLFPEVLDSLEMKYGSYHIIPSSVHEVLIVPDSLRIGAQELKDMLVDVNSTIVSDKDILDDHIYRYENGRLSVVD